MLLHTRAWQAGLPQLPWTQGTVEGRVLWPWWIDRPLPREYPKRSFGNPLYQSERILRCALELNPWGADTESHSGELRVPLKALRHHIRPAIHHYLLQALFQPPRESLSGDGVTNGL